MNNNTLYIKELDKNNELKDFRDKSFCFYYNDVNKEEENKSNMEEFLNFYSISKGVKPEYFNILFELEENPLYKYISICSCGHIHLFSNEDIDNYRFGNRNVSKNCPNCDKPFLLEMTDNEYEFKESYFLDYAFQFGIDNTLSTLNLTKLRLNIYEYYFTIYNGYIKIYVKNKLDCIFYKDDIIGTSSLFNDNYFECEECFSDSTKELIQSYYNTLYDYNPLFKEFMEKINLDFEDDEIEKIIRAYYVFVNFQNCENIILSENETNNISELKSLKYALMKSGIERECDADELKDIYTNLVKNTALIKQFLSYFELNIEDDFENIILDNYDSIHELFPFIQELDETNLLNYIGHFIENSNYSIDYESFIELMKLRNEFKDIDTNMFLKYICRGLMNEEIKLKDMLSQIDYIRKYYENKNEKFEINNAFKSKDYYKIRLLYNMGDKIAEIFIKTEKENNFDGMYKQLMNI